MLVDFKEILQQQQESWSKWVNEGVYSKQQARECINYIQENYNTVSGDVQLKFDRDLLVLKQYLRTK